MEAMRNLRWMTPLLFMASCYFSTPEKPAIADKALIKKQVEKSFRAMMDAAFNKDIERYFRYIHKGYIGIDDNGNVITSSMALEKMFRENSRLLDNYESFNFEKLSVKVLSPEVVLVVTQVQAAARLKNQKKVTLFGGYIQTWQKKDNTWLVVSSSSTVKPAL